MCWVVPVSEIGWDEGGGTHQTTTTNDDIDVVVRRLVATSLSATWHLQTLPSVSFRCDVAPFMLAVVVVGVGDGCEWRPLAMVTVVVVKQGGGDEMVGRRREGWWWWWLKKKIVVC